jgi:hypothetical protein
MTVKELIEQLQQCDPATLVVIPGYEGGYNDVNYVFRATLKKHENLPAYEGMYQTPDAQKADTSVICIDVNSREIRGLD